MPKFFVIKTTRRERKSPYSYGLSSSGRGQMGSGGGRETQMSVAAPGGNQW